MVPKRCETEGMGLLYVPSGATLPYLLQQLHQHRVPPFTAF